MEGPVHFGVKHFFLFLEHACLNEDNYWKRNKKKKKENQSMLVIEYTSV